MAGKAHWSAAIEGDSMTEAIALDIACRTAKLPERLGSAYGVPTIWNVDIQSKTKVLIEHPHGFQVEIESIGNTTVIVEDHKLLVQPSIDPTLHERGQTYRWRYIVRTIRE